jgi:manganese/iron transport system permease protein
MDTILTFLISPLSYEFLVRILVSVILVSITCAFVGTFIVLRGMAFFGDALAHSILPGIAIGYVFSGSDRGILFWWALATAILSSLGINVISKSTRIKEDTAIGVIFAGMFALGIALISTVRDYAVDLTHFLFGNVLSISQGDLWRIIIFGGIVVLGIFVFYKEFLVLSFDQTLAITLRLPVGNLEILLLILIAISVVVALQSVGVALMVAMLTTPAATAYLVTRQMHWMMVVSAIIAALSAIIGFYISYYFNVASGAAIVLSCTVLFILVWLVNAYTSMRKRANIRR